MELGRLVNPKRTHSRLLRTSTEEITIINTHYGLHSYLDVNDARGAALKLRHSPPAEIQSLKPSELNNKLSFTQSAVLYTQPQLITRLLLRIFLQYLTNICSDVVLTLALTLSVTQQISLSCNPESIASNPALLM